MGDKVIPQRPPALTESDLRLILIGYSLTHSKDRTTKEVESLVAEQDSRSNSVTVSKKDGDPLAAFTYGRATEYYLLGVAYMLANHGNIGWLEDAIKRMRREDA